MKKNTYQDLKVWKKAHELTLGIYELIGQLPREEQYGLKSQIRRASVSTVLNIVEGKSRRSKKEFRHFLYTSRASNEEVHYLLILLKDLNYVSSKQYEHWSGQCEEVGKMLNGLINAIQPD